MFLVETDFYLSLIHFDSTGIFWKIVVIEKVTITKWRKIIFMTIEAEILYFVV
jgi:hypothetical protein